MLAKLLLIAGGGALGALLRYAVARGIIALLGSAFPWGTLAANLAGCLFIGALWAWSEETAFSAEARAFVFVGVLGAFTTFSTFGLESVALLRGGEIGLGLAYVVASNAGGLLLVYLGAVLARAVLRMG